MARVEPVTAAVPGAQQAEARVLIVCHRFGYGKPERGLAFEYYNLYLPMKDVAREVVLFEWDTELAKHGREAMNEALVDVVQREKPDVTVFALFRDEIIPDTVAKARRHTATVCYFTDDIWRRDFVSYWAPRFDFFTASTTAMLRRYRAGGLSGAVYSPVGYNAQLYDRRPPSLQYDVSFVGGSHPWRVFLIRKLQRAGIDVAVFGPFWNGGRLDQDHMVDTFSGSRINLNISNARQWDGRYLLSSWRALRNTLRTPKFIDGIKARHFEIPACGGFQLTYYCDDLERHFAIGEEVAVYHDPDDLVDRVRYYLANEAERSAVAAAGYERARRDHSAQTRLRALLAEVMARKPLA